MESEILEERTAVWEMELEEIRTEGKAQESKVQKMRSTLQQCELELQRAISSQDGPRSQLLELKDAENAGRHLSRWASAEERVAWTQKVEAAQNKLNATAGMLTTAMNARERARMDLEPEQKRLTEISNREIILRGLLSGGPFIDPETFLTVIP